MYNISTEITMKILIMGLPGSGKTTLAKLLVPKLNAVWHNADDVRKTVHTDLGFEEKDRLENARRLRFWADKVVECGHISVTDFVCPMPKMRKIFDADFTIWVDRIKEGRFDDTNQLFTPPKNYDIQLTDGDPERWLNQVLTKMNNGWNNKASTAQVLGRFQPFHDGHFALVKNAIVKVGQVAICVRNTEGTSDKDPFDFDTVRENIQTRLDMAGYKGKYQIILMPNITNVHYGRDVGYKIEQIRFGKAIELITATDIRNNMKKS